MNSIRVVLIHPARTCCVQLDALAAGLSDAAELHAGLVAASLLDDFGDG